MTNNEQATYYYDPTTGERMTVTYLVTLVVPSNSYGQVKVKAQTEAEAARLALGRVFEIDWEPAGLSMSEIEVLDVECDDPPEGALLSHSGSSEADISECFENASVDGTPGFTGGNAPGDHHAGSDEECN